MGLKFNWNTASLICLVLAILIGAPVRAAVAEASASGASHRAGAHKAVASKLAARTHSAIRASSRGTAGVRTSVAYRSRGRGGGRAVLAVRRTRHPFYERFTASSFADNLTLGDTTAGADPVVRAAAIDALGNMNGTALAIDPSSGRILAMVNQKLALSSGAEPCSTIKLAVGLAALDEGLITKDTPVNLGGHYTMTLTKALALSINPYFETLGRMLGFERVKQYANEFGLGELAGYNIAGEQLGALVGILL